MKSDDEGALSQGDAQQLCHVQLQSCSASIMFSFNHVQPQNWCISSKCFFPPECWRQTRPGAYEISILLRLQYDAWQDATSYIW